MEQINKNIIIFFILISFLILVVATFNKVYLNHTSNLYKVIEKRIIERARTCLLDEICSGDNIKLRTLINNGYIDNQIDPVSKEYISTDTIIKCNLYDCSVDLKRN